MGSKKRKRKLLKMKLNDSSDVSRLESVLLGVRKILRQNWLFVCLLVILCLVVYFNMLQGEFSIVDDIPGIINNLKLYDIWGNVKIFSLQNVVNSIFLNFFGQNPVPFHLWALVLHVLITIQVFVFSYLIFGKRVAQISSVLFAVHPVNTEAVSWISGTPYLLHGIFFYGAMISYVVYIRSRKIKYFVLCVVLFSLILLFSRSPWILTLPLVLVVFDQFILGKKFNFKSLAKFWYFLIPIVPYFLTYFQSASGARLASRSEGSFMNQQTLNPILESYPYTIYSMLRLYLFPKFLTVYYDGNIITKVDYILMTVVTLVFLFVILIFWKKGFRKIVGLLLMLIVSLAASFSPIKVTWFIAERYLYFGTGFFSILLALGILECSKRLKIKYLAVGLTGLLVFVYSWRTIVRNNDWRYAKGFALATIKSSPFTVRPYNDLGSLYFMDKEYEIATDYYRQALEINPLSRTAIHNIGLIYLNTGDADYVKAPSFNLSEKDKNNPELLFRKGLNALKNKKITNAIYYLVEGLKFKSDSPGALSLLGDTYLKAEKWKFSEKYYLRSLDLDPEQANVYFKLSYVAFKQGNYSEALKFVQKTLDLDPENKNALKNIEIIKKKLDELKRE